MKRFKKTIVSALCALMLASVSGACGGNAPIHEDRLDIPVYSKSERMTLGVYHAPSPFWKDTQQNFDDIAEMGLNLIIPEQGTMNFAVGPQGNVKYLDFTFEAGKKVPWGLKTMVCDRDLSNNLTPAAPFSFNTKNLKYYIKHPAVYGVEVRDEPAASEFDDIKLLQDKWNIEVEKGVIPADKLFYVNLWIRDNMYLDEYMQTVKPPILSFDHYPFLEDLFTGEYNIKPYAFRFFDECAYAAKKYSAEWGREVPVHAIVLSAQHLVGNVKYKEINPADLRWQVGAAMSFGIKLISFYNFSYINTRPDDFYYQQVIDPDTGEKTQLYYDMQEVLLELREWDYVYTKFDWLDTATIYGSREEWNLLLSYTDNAGNIEPQDLEGIKSVVSSEDGFISAYKDAKGRLGYFAYNAAAPWEEKTANTTIQFKDAKIKAVQVYERGVPVVKPLEKNQKITLSLGAGESKFIIPLYYKA